MSSTQLPFDILLLVCDCLAQIHAASSQNFALVCTEWRAVAKVFQHRSISIFINSERLLKADVEDCLESLKRTNSLKHVRRLEIAGPGPKPRDDEFSRGPAGWRKAQAYEDFGETLFDNHDPSVSFPLLERTSDLSAVECLPEQSWQPVVKLISQLPALTDLFWNCVQRMPEIIIETLQERLPPCKLWLNSFRWTNRDQPFPYASDCKLFSSPNLYAFRLEYTIWHSSRSLPNTEPRQANEIAALHRFVCSTATNLRKVLVSRYTESSAFLGNKALPGEGLVTTNALQPRTRGSLHSIRLDKERHTYISTWTLAMWTEFTDFSVLRSLELPGRGDACFYQQLCAVPFRDLRSISLNIPEPKYASNATFEELQRFLVTIPALETLQLSDHLHLVDMEPVLKRHGPTLKSLWLMQAGTHNEKPQFWEYLCTKHPGVLAAVHKYCTRLEKLAIPIRRSKGNAAEVGSYKILGTLPKLRVLNLTLDCSDYSVFGWLSGDANDEVDSTWPELRGARTRNSKAFNQAPCRGFSTLHGPKLQPDFSPQGVQVLNQHILDAFINCAIDEHLARGIFTCISQQKSHNEVPLQHLSLHIWKPVAVKMYSTPPEVSSVANLLSNNWSVSRSTRDDRPQEIFAEKLMDKKKKKTTNRQDSDIGSKAKSSWGKPVEEILQRLWPELKGARDLDQLSRCPSFPLQSAELAPR
ncbi:hypothetical protein CKM354_000876100 [Cercospora kikuchii]|uniref:F-box domain-containing protein n=1 Tax=Cercospora kikuchii TaxID=84275 RepID=A0A9P3FIQ4_9PEZI|nr:uncharacterized protein CKM354_000876100 [Cercospora kikuchii]GIZ45602.1 hypothetical protein CKM354_000876100 [Cercospora kikuchii]